MLISKRLQLQIVAVAMLGGMSVANAALVGTGPTMPTETVSFDAYGSQRIGSGLLVDGTNGQQVLVSSSENGLIWENAAFGDNGYWPSPGQGMGSFAASSSGDDPWFRYVRLDLLVGPVAAVGGFLDYCVGPYSGCADLDVSITAIGAGGAVLETYNILRTSPVPLGGSYRGIERSSNDILALEVSSNGTFFALDNLQYKQISAVPEVNSSLLFAVGAISIVALRWKVSANK